MTDEMLSQILSASIERTVSQNRKSIVEALNNELPNGKTMSEDMERLLLMTLRLSMQLTIQETIRSLEAAGYLSTPPEGTPILYPLP